MRTTSTQVRSRVGKEGGPRVDNVGSSQAEYSSTRAGRQSASGGRSDCQAAPLSPSQAVSGWSHQRRLAVGVS